MPQTNEQPKDQFCFELGQFAVEQPTDGKKKRTFTGIAYSGEPIVDHWYWERIIFDLDTIQIKGRIPALLEHRTSQRAGAINSHSVSYEEGLKIEGSLLSNEFGTQVAQDSDDGFPWQMSVRIEPSSTEEIAADQTVSVNGKTYQGPITVFRGGRIREVSFCALGADDNTNAVAASHSPKNFNQPEDTDVDLVQAQAKITELEGQVNTLTEQNKQFAAAKREAEITTLGKDLGKEFSAEDIAEMKNLDESAFAFSAKHLRQFSATQPQKSQLPDYLTKHQAQGGQNQFNAGQPQSIADLAKARK